MSFGYFFQKDKKTDNKVYKRRKRERYIRVCFNTSPDSSFNIWIHILYERG